MVKNTDERVKLKPDRIKYWMSVGALPSENVAVLHQEVHDEVRGDAGRRPAAAAAAPPAADRRDRRTA